MYNATMKLGVTSVTGKVFKDIDQDEMLRTIDAQLEQRNWGIRCKGKSPGEKPRYYIMDYRGLALVTGIVRYYFYQESKEESAYKLFYRGQGQDWELRPSLYRGCKTKENMEEQKLKHEQALKIVAKHFDPQGEPDEREALAQHYGLHTRFFDVVDHIQTALWFAYDEVGNSKQNESVGYVYIIAVPKEAKAIDLRRKPSEWLRPHVQQAFCVRFPNPDSELGKVSKYLVMTLVIPRTSLRAWSNYDNIPHDYFFPSEEVDQGAAYWSKAKKELQAQGLFPNS